MNWKLRYAVRSYARGSLWLTPLLAVVLYLIFQEITYAVSGWLLRTGRIDTTTALLGLTMDGATAMLGSVVTLNLSYLVFTFGSLLVAIQVAGGQYTPRIIATTLLRDNVIRATSACFVFSLFFALRVLTRMSDTVDQFNTLIAVLLGLLSLTAFLYLIDYAARMLRPVSLVDRIGTLGIGVIQEVYPQKTAHPEPGHPALDLGPPDRVVPATGRSGVVLAFDLAGLAELARHADGIIQIVPQVGDFLAVDEPLFKLYRGAAGIDDLRLRESVVLGTERTMDQDPTFAFRILVDIGIKALSAAINDPTTAVLALDQLHRLLRVTGLRELRSETFHDDAGKLRMVFFTPNWEDYVHLACTEIRHCGAGSIQVVRRMRSMLENLMLTLPPHRRPELRLQLELLDRTVDSQFPFPEDRMLARIGDAQGLGGALGIQPQREAAPAGPAAADRTGM